VSPAERAALGELLQWGMTDVFRAKYADDGLYSWWDYRGGDFHQGRGMRIDLMLATQAVASKTSWVGIDRNSRKSEQPSDHAPVLMMVDA